MLHIEDEANPGIVATATFGRGGSTKPAAFEPNFATAQIEPVTRVEIHLRLAGKEDVPALALSDQLANTVGLKPRHMRRASDAGLAAACELPEAGAAEPASKPLWYLADVVLGVDRSTPELRSRIGKAKTAPGVKSAARLPPLVAWPVLVGTCLGIGDLVLGW